jgi:diaminopropionate ammonia-lyase
MAVCFENPRRVVPGSPAPAGDVAPSFHRALDGYAPTPLTALPDVAASVGVGELWVKDESSRFGLPSYKVLGASYATARLLAQRAGVAGEWRDIERVARRARELGLRLVAPTDGNHGRAVAWMARRFGLRAVIFFPAGTADARLEAVESEGAEFVVVDGGYVETYLAAARYCGEEEVLVTDFSLDGTEESPRWTIDGYATIFWELQEQVAEAAAGPIDLVAVQVGAGALAAATTRWTAGLDPAPVVVSVEPRTSACLDAALRAGEWLHIDAGTESVMAGLNCDAISRAAFPELQAGVDISMTIDDAAARAAVRLLADCGIPAGESGAAGLAGLAELRSLGCRAHGADLRLDGTATALVIVTEAPTDPVSAALSLART